MFETLSLNLSKLIDQKQNISLSQFEPISWIPHTHTHFIESVLFPTLSKKW